MSQPAFSVSAGYYPAAQLVAEALKALLPPEPANVADYAAARRYLSNEGGGYVGRWNHDQAPYLIKPMEELSNQEFLTEVIVGPGQCGKSEIGRNWLFTTALCDPADMLWYSGSEPQVSTESKINITRMINDHPELHALLRDNSLFFKRFGSMSVQFLAGIMSNFTMKSAPRILADEWDLICKGVPNAKPLLDVRRQTFGAQSKLVALSHPDLANGLETKDWNAGIMELYRDSDQRKWFWQCPSCGAYSSPNPTASRVMTIDYDAAAPDDEIRDMARLCCPVNGCIIEDSQRYAMNLTGKWVGKGQDIDEDGTVTGALVQRDTAGFWIVGAMSPFILGGIGGLAVARARAERKFARDNDRKALAEVLSKQWGIPLARSRSSETIDATVIAERAEPDLTLGIVANGVRFITVMIDVQINRFELLARGWCEGGGSVVIDFQTIPATPGTSAADWDRVLTIATETAWPLEDDMRRGMKAVAVGFDSAGAAGVTLQSYEAWKRLKARRGARLHGRIDGRPAWSVLPMKGASTLQAPRLQVVYPNAQRTDRFAQARGEVPLGIFNPNSFKDDLAAQLILGDGANWSVRFPKALAADAPPHPWFEQLVAEERDANGRWKPRQDGTRNEATDLMVGTHVLAFMMGINRIKWEAPPVWARDWKSNSHVIAVAAAASGEQRAAAAATTAASPPREATPATASAVKSRFKMPPLKIINSVPLKR
ncbi:MAG TPA: terminase gpA endonuclease subunit [Acidocella sp.]|uniref:terminase gpA endonuclease subunit n=1 Tax=Acidocella sp. TaxID=50710 RepID=UPI002CA4D596|nr:terminase gpA endonuclease subunit [Acidocella sp.]HVE20643.1 terminase gpA endonuclease subunit [Acidocella sp.]